MASNLPCGCLDSDIPGNSPLEQELDRRAEQKACVACMFYDLCSQANDKADCSYFRELDDIHIFGERIAG